MTLSHKEETEYYIDKIVFDIFIEYIYHERIITEQHAKDSRINQIIDIIKSQGYKGTIQ